MVKLITDADEDDNAYADTNANGHVPANAYSDYNARIMAQALLCFAKARLNGKKSKANKSKTKKKNASFIWIEVLAMQSMHAILFFFVF